MVLARGGAFFRRAGVGRVGNGSRGKADKQEATLVELSETLASSTVGLSRCSNQIYPSLFQNSLQAIKYR